MAEWQPIETAPRDGTRIQLLIPYDRDKFTEAQCTDEGYWDADVEHDVNRRQPDGTWKLVVIERGCFRFDGDDGAFDIQPTHWRPIGGKDAS
jgi:hypothetical protein